MIEAVGIWDFLIDSVFERFDARFGEGKAKISREVVPVLSLISDKIVQDHYVNLVSKRLEVSSEAVMEQLSKQTGKEAGKKDVELTGHRKKRKKGTFGRKTSFVGFSDIIPKYFLKINFGTS